MSVQIVVCDDEELIRWSLATHLTGQGFVVTTATNGEEALEKVAEVGARLLLTDLNMPVLDGLTALRRLRASGSTIPVIVLTAHGGVESAIEATQLGADAYLQKPFDLREVTLAVQQVLARDQLRNEVVYHRERSRAGYGDFLGQAPVLQPLYATLRRLETVDAPTLLITGESGTGKDVLARTVHNRGPRANKPFVAVDCASLPEHLIESELFGHERGAFTDAKSMKRGLFEVAEGGVVFLDEIGELPIGTQSKLLRALEERTYKRVGGVHRASMNIAVVAATNRDLRAEVDAGRFREDLFFRLNVIRVHLPPLRDRREDIPLLVSHFLDVFARRFGRSMEGADGDVIESMAAYAWPGNVRELRNVMERMVLLSAAPRIALADLPPEIRFGKAPQQASAAHPIVLPEEGINLEEVERSLLQQAIERTGGNQSATAKLLGITRYAVRYRLAKFGLE